MSTAGLISLYSIRYDISNKPFTKLINYDTLSK